MEEKNICIEVLNPIISSNCSAVTPLNSENVTKKTACQRYSETQATSFGKQLIDSHRKLNHVNFQKESLIKIENFPIEEMTLSNKSQKGQSFEEVNNPKKEFQYHKRHRTDYKIM